MNNFTEPAEKLSSDLREYIDARIDNLKLHAVKGLSQGTSTIAGILLMFVLGCALILTLALAFILLIGELIGSYAAAALIVAGALFLALILTVSFRKRLFRNTFVSMFVDVFFPENPLESEKQDEL